MVLVCTEGDRISFLASCNGYSTVSVHYYGCDGGNIPADQADSQHLLPSGCKNRHRSSAVYIDNETVQCCDIQGDVRVHT